jgi:hypothetical protein
MENTTGIITYKIQFEYDNCLLGWVTYQDSNGDDMEFLNLTQARDIAKLLQEHHKYRPLEGYRIVSSRGKYFTI